MENDVMGNEGINTPLPGTAQEMPVKRRLWPWALVVLILLAISGAVYWYWTTTPQYSLNCIAKAAKQHDLVAFKKYVDLESVTNRGVNELVEVLMSDPDEVQNDFAGLAKSFVEALKPELVRQITAEIESYIETGKFENENQDAGFSMDNLLKISNDNSAPSVSIGKVKKEGKIAIVELNIDIPEYNKSLMADIKMRNLGKYWQVAEISNFGELVREIEKIEKAKLEELNRPVQKQLDQIVTFARITV